MSPHLPLKTNKQKQLPDHPGMPPPKFVPPSQFHPEHRKVSSDLNGKESALHRRPLL